MPKDATTSIVLADDHPFVLRGILDLLRSEARFEILAACANGSEALEAIRASQPDIAVLDIAMPELSGLQILAMLVQERLRTRVILLTAMACDADIVMAMKQGVAGLLLKQDASEILIECIDAVAAGGHWLPPEIVEPALAREATHRAGARPPATDLTLREQQIAQLVARGLSNKEIARLLRVSDGTVKVHLHNVYQKLGLPNRVALAVFTGSEMTRRS